MERIRVHSEHQHYHPLRRTQPWYSPEGMKPSYSGSSSARAARPVQCPLPRRSRTSNTSQEYHRTRRESEPWRRAAKTCAWVVEQEIAEMARKNDDTVRWIHHQQEKDRRERAAFEMWGAERGFYGDIMDDLMDEEITYTSRRRAERSQYQLEMDRMIREELHRLQAQRSETERCRAAYERRKVVEEERERQRARKREIERLQRSTVEKAAWQSYESAWSKLASADPSSEPLTFDTIPWPMLSPPRNVEDIRPARVTMFVLSPHHSQGHTTKDRVRSALRRWHPDRFGRLLARVREEDRGKVEAGVGIVVRCLNELLERAER